MATPNPPRDVRHVIVHTPGPSWVHGKPVFEQPGVQAHVEYFRGLREQGKLALGGPFLDAGGGGMMIPTPGLSRDEVTAMANADPAIAAGLLRVEVREWMIGMKA